MRPSTILVFALVCATHLACSSSAPEADGSASSDADRRALGAASAKPAKPAKPPEPPPEWLLLSWDTKLRTAPEQYAPALTLIAPEGEQATRDRGRVIKVIGKADPDGHWWKLETVGRDHATISGLAGQPIEGLDVYALTLYVPAGTGEPVRTGEPTPTPDPETAREQAIEHAAQYGIIGVLNSASVVTQSGQPRPPSLTTEWQIDVGAKVYWPDGTIAGSVREAHAFVAAGEARTIGRRELRCFAVRVGPPMTSPTELCFEPGVVREVATPTVAQLFGDDVDTDVLGGLLTGDIGDGGAFGFGITGTGMQNGGPDYGSGIGEIGTIGYGSGTSSVRIANVSSDDSDADLIRRIVRSRMSELRECHGKTGSASGSLTLTLILSDAGKVTAASAKGVDTKLCECVEAAADDWQFPSGFGGSAVVELSFDAG